MREKEEEREEVERGGGRGKQRGGGWRKGGGGRGGGRGKRGKKRNKRRRRKRRKTNTSFLSLSFDIPARTETPKQHNTSNAVCKWDISHPHRSLLLRIRTTILLNRTVFRPISLEDSQKRSLLYLNK